MVELLHLFAENGLIFASLFHRRHEAHSTVGSISGAPGNEQPAAPAHHHTYISPPFLFRLGGRCDLEMEILEDNSGSWEAADGLPKCILNQLFAGDLRSRRDLIFCNVALGEPNYLLYFQRIPCKTRQLPPHAHARAEIKTYPSLPEFPHPCPSGYPQFPPQCFGNAPRKKPAVVKREAADTVASSQRPATARR